MIKILIADDNKHIVSAYKSYFAKDKNIKVLDCAFDGNTAIELYNQFNPDIFILDLNLPKKNGIEIIDQISFYETNNNITNNCNIIVISGNSKLRHKLYNTKKVYRIIPKPVNYQSIYKTIQEYVNDNSKKEFPINLLRNLLLQLNLNPNSKSCKHLINIIKLEYENQNKFENIKELYETVAFQSDYSYESIRSSVRSCIRTVNRFASKDLLYSIFFLNEYDSNKTISPKYFVNCIINYLNVNNT